MRVTEYGQRLQRCETLFKSLRRIRPLLPNTYLIFASSISDWSNMTWPLGKFILLEVPFLLHFSLRVGHRTMLESTHPEVRVCMQIPALDLLLVSASGQVSRSKPQPKNSNEWDDAGRAHITMAGTKQTLNACQANLKNHKENVSNFSSQM